MLHSSIFYRSRLCHPSQLQLVLFFTALVALSCLPRISGTAALVSSVNAATMLLAEESLRRNNPISNGRLFPRSRIAFRPVVPRSATFASRAADFRGASGRRSVSKIRCEICRIFTGGPSFITSVPQIRSTASHSEFDEADRVNVSPFRWK